MARPIKKGLDYFPLDIGFFKDIKFRKIKSYCGAYTSEILLNILSNIYADCGYYIKWDDDLSFLIGDEVCSKEDNPVDLVDKVVDKALQVGFFNVDIYNTYKILTSSGIQKRYFSAISRRKEVEIIQDILLINVDELVNVSINKVYADINGNIENINSINSYNSTQSKVKESKEKKSTVEESKEEKSILEHKKESKKKKTENQVFYIDDEELNYAFEEFVKMRKSIKKPLTDRAMQLAMNTLDKLADSNEDKIQILNQSIMNCWQGLFPLKKDDYVKSNKSHRDDKKDVLGEMIKGGHFDDW